MRGFIAPLGLAAERTAGVFAPIILFHGAVKASVVKINSKYRNDGTVIHVAKL